MNSASEPRSCSGLSTLFVGQNVSNDYALHRHSYSDEVFQLMSDYCRETLQDLTLAVDVGCGPGNSTVGFTKHFKQVIGVDISETQIALAPKNIPNCQFKVSCATNLDFLPTGSVDLFASGLAFNLMPQTETLAEADRVLRQGGTLAIFGYGLARATDKILDDILQKTFKEVRCLAPKEMLMALDAYSNVEIPYPGSIRKDGLIVKHNFSLEGLLAGFQVIDRWIAGSSKNQFNAGDLLEEFKQKVVTAFPESLNHPSRKVFELVSNVVVVMGHKPSE